MVSEEDLQQSAKDVSVTTFQHPKEIVFSHQYITNELEKNDLNLDGCTKCGPAHQHFTDPRSHYDSLTEKGISWVKSCNAKMTTPFPNLKTYMNDTTNIKYKHQ